MTPLNKPIHLGTLFDDMAARGSTTAVRLSRPLDIAPEAGVELDVPSVSSLVRRAAGWFAEAGVRSGDRVAIVKRNHWDYVLLSCAAARLGAVPASLSAHLAPRTLETLLRRLDPALLVTDTALLRGARDAGHDPSAHAARTLVVDGTVEGALSLGDVRGGTAPPPRRPHLDAPLAIMHTSGTTGVPKLVVHSTRTIMRRLAGFESHRWPILGSRRDDTVASSISFAHGRALAWTAGVLWLFPEAISVITAPDWDEAGPALRLHRPTTLEAQPSTLVRWQRHLDERGEGLRRVRLFISTFDAVHPSTVRAFLNASERRAPVWMQGWGQSETGPLTFRFLTRRSLSRRQGPGPTTRDLGRPIPGRTRLRAVDPATLLPVPPGTPGLLFCRTDALCPGYVGEEGRWRDKLVGQWWSTGDIGSIDRTGAVRLVDREVDALAEGGCLEIEDVVDERLPQVLECVVLGVADGPPVPVVATEDGTLDPGVWKEAVVDLPTMADPVVLTWDDLPRTGTGKVRRAALRESLGLPSRTRATGRWT
ncbi:class I adenylate-forming enzyme family protein [Nocardiopsis lambiniae]|uniref:Class I adenylate-forming enzyme family protein n=1 Tax=Nocardiopsis lambiniae TaxID=3075539 RepID=A0ABU2M840_9ACTN|nr:class I adenylate-forming enzyme family protein [Nocardiopsis sp. DSM 44743]MDT0328325.1 class I adenylate-forming enzyme family protein [Nocardiopsis sp. DSM 44743]